MSDRRMDAYYYSFTPTGVEVIDKVLGAVACAGKAFHNTQDWYDEAHPYDDHTGEAPIDWVQNAANEAAAEIERLRAAMQWRPIEEAPKDGTVVLLFNGHIHRAEWDGTEWRPPNVYGGLILGATHWMPLPPPPAGETND